MVRNGYIRIRLTSDEKENLRKICEEKEMDMSEYIRKKIKEEK